MENKTVAQEIRSRKIKRPNAIYTILGTVWKLFMAPKYNVRYTFKADPRQRRVRSSLSATMPLVWTTSSWACRCCL